MSAANTILTLCVFLPLALLAGAGVLHLIASRTEARRGAWRITAAQRLHNGAETDHGGALRGAIELAVIIALLLATFGWLALV